MDDLIDEIENVRERPVVSVTGARCPVETFVTDAERFAKRGYSFQERLRPHPDVREVCGERIATVRIVIAMTDDGPALPVEDPRRGRRLGQFLATRQPSRDR